MSILTTLNPLTNADRFQMWCGAFRYLGKADPLFAVVPKHKINLAIKERQRVAEQQFRELEYRFHSTEKNNV